MLKSQLLNKQLERVTKREERLHHKKTNSILADTINPTLEQIQSKIPAKLKSTLDLAFYKGFQFVFEKGNPLIEKTYNKERIQSEHDINNYAVDSHGSHKHLKKMDQNSFQSKLWNESISFVEGSVLGLLGIGLPDIPLFISVILRTVQETALNYGYHYVTDEEKAYTLYIICGALTKDETQMKYSEKIDALARQIDFVGDRWEKPEGEKGTGSAVERENSHGVDSEGHKAQSGETSTPELDLDLVMKETAQVLSDSLLTIKFIQGLPIVGVLGGFVNPAIIHKIGKYASIKYKKRYLTKKVHVGNHLLS